jgi:AcrR family transcriptional regulator
MSDTPLPPSIELAWGIRGRPTRGPKRSLTLEAIVAAGIEVAATAGLGAVSMSRVADELGASTMSLYRYVTAKEDLLSLMMDAAMGPAPGAHVGPGGWRAALGRWADGIHAGYLSNPWSLRVPISTPPLGPNNLAWMEDGLACLEGTGLSEQHKASSMLLMSGFVRNDATLNADFAAGGHDPRSGPTYGDMLRRLITPATFPYLWQAVADGIFDDDEGIEAEYVFGRERVLDGIAVLIEQANQKAKAVRPARKRAR